MALQRRNQEHIIFFFQLQLVTAAQRTRTSASLYSLEYLFKTLLCQPDYIISNLDKVINALRILIKRRIYTIRSNRSRNKRAKSTSSSVTSYRNGRRVVHEQFSCSVLIWNYPCGYFSIWSAYGVRITFCYFFLVWNLWIINQRVWGKSCICKPANAEIRLVPR